MHHSSATLARPACERPNLDGGKPVHPAVQACEGLVEAIMAVEDDTEAMEHGARCAAAIASALVERAKRLRTTVLPEIKLGYDAAEKLAESVRR